MQMAIGVLQTNDNTGNIFISSPETYLTLTRWTNIQGWEAFARIFRSNIVIRQKPNGTYLMPIFSGPENGGHWYLIAVHKHGNFKQGVVIDSLGKGNSQNPLLCKISDAFAPGRGQVRWDVNRESVLQTELECGHRTIIAMKIICDELARGSSFEQSVSRATLHNTTLSRPYEASEIRRKVNNLINTFEPHMTAVPIRL